MMAIRKLLFAVTGLLSALLLYTHAYGAVVEYDLTIGYKDINITGKTVQAIMVNGQLPAPTLHFTEGDIARIRVHNALDTDSSIHWHGILVPPEMDGVPYVSFPPIKAGTTFVYEFPIRQNGTYWYHSHTGLQEQRGLYGSIVVLKKDEKPIADIDHVTVLSDWTDTSPTRVYRMLRMGSEAPALQKGASQSIFGALKLGMLGDYFTRQLRRMPAIDVADVAYDRFLINGKPESRLIAKPGQTIRLRVIDGSSSTFFLLEYAGGPMTIISADGQPVEPVEENRFLISVAETYDVLIQVPEKGGSYEFRATAQDGSAYASLWIGGPGPLHFAADIPKPNLYHQPGKLSWSQIFAFAPQDVMNLTNARVKAGDFDAPGPLMHRAMGMTGKGHMMDMQSMHGDDMKMDSQHSTMAMEPQTIPDPLPVMPKVVLPQPKATGDDELSYPVPKAPSGKSKAWDFGFLAPDVASSGPLANVGTAERPWPPYARLRATHNTSLSKDAPRRDIRLTLDGDMERYVWMINGEVLSESESIKINKGEVVRFIMINRTMMHHPMHLHGHFFRVINGQGDYSPLKHTVDVAPMSTTVIEFDANEFGDWFFHCHLLYHLEAGMARLVHYNGFEMYPALAAVRPELYRTQWTLYGEVDALSNTTEGSIVLDSARHIFTAEWEIGWQIIDYVESEFTLTYDYSFNRFLSTFFGTDFYLDNDELDVARGILGVRYLLPLDIRSRTWVDTSGGIRVTLNKIVEFTPRLSMDGEAQFDSHELWEGIIGINYALTPSFALRGQWHSDYGWGGGFHFEY